MEEDEGGPRLSKRFSDKAGEVDYKTKAGTAWSHSYLNQKPWHPLSYPNQRRKWIAEQTHAQRQRRTDELAREYAQEQEFLRQTSLLSQKEKEKVDMMQAVSFMYVRPPGYNAESAKAAEVADERKKHGEDDPNVESSSSVLQQTAPLIEEKKKQRPKDVFGRTLPTEEEFAVLKNAPRLETGVPGRVKPFAVEVRNVKCVRCGNFGHQSGDRECPLKDAIMPNDESRRKRDDPLTAIMAHMDSSEPLKWELKQRPGISPPRGGFMPDDPNQQIVAEDIFDEYGGFLNGGDGIPELLTNFSSGKHKKKKKSKSKSKHKRRSSRQSNDDDDPSSESDHHRRSSKTKQRKQTSQEHGVGEDDSSSESGRERRRSRGNEKMRKHKKKKKGSPNSGSSEDSEDEMLHGKKLKSPIHSDEETSIHDSDRYRRRSKRESTYKNKKMEKDFSDASSSDDLESAKSHHKSKYFHAKDHYSDKLKKNGIEQELRTPHNDGPFDREKKSLRKEKTHRSRDTTRDGSEFSSGDLEFERHRDRRKHKRPCSLENSNANDNRNSRDHRHRWHLR